MAACRRLVRINPSFATHLTKVRGYSASRVSDSSEKLQIDGSSMNFGASYSSSSRINRFNYRKISQLAKPSGNRAFLVDTLALVRSLEAQGVPSKQAEAITAAITEVLNDSLENVAHSFVSKEEMQHDHHFSLLQRETEKLRTDIEKMRSELRRIRDELAKQNAETTNLTNKLDRVRKFMH